MKGMGSERYVGNLFIIIIAIAILMFVVYGLYQIIFNSRKPSQPIPPRGSRQSRQSGVRPSGQPSRAVRPPHMDKPPAALGVPAGHPARAAAETIEAALTASFETMVKGRVLGSKPEMTELQWQWRWFELKRYFLMCAVLRSVPMYSDKVDEVWHEMLMFTWEYGQFCQKISGGFIHHAPHTADSKPQPGERAWFDWVYGELFPIERGSVMLWGSFYTVPLPRHRIDQFQTAEDSELRHKLFNMQAIRTHKDIADIADHLIRRGRMLSGAASGALRSRGDEQSNQALRDDGFGTGLMSGLFFSTSMGPEDGFLDRMRQEQEQSGPPFDSGANCAGAGFMGDGSGDTGQPGSGSTDQQSCHSGGCSSGGDNGGNSCSSGGSDSGSSSCSTGSDSGGSSCSSGSDGGGSSCGSSCGGGGGS
jgi:uncharacterized membrane protein YgcG